MAVQIDEMQVDVDDPIAPAATQQELHQAPAPFHLGRELQMLAERQLRLKGD